MPIVVKPGSYVEEWKKAREQKANQKPKEVKENGSDKHKKAENDKHKDES